MFIIYNRMHIYNVYREMDVSEGNFKTFHEHNDVGVWLWLARLWRAISYCHLWSLNIKIPRVCWSVCTIMRKHFDIKMIRMCSMVARNNGCQSEDALIDNTSKTQKGWTSRDCHQNWKLMQFIHESRRSWCVAVNALPKAQPKSWCLSFQLRLNSGPNMRIWRKCGF